MKKTTRDKFNSLCKGLAQGYAVEDVSKQFAIEPSVAQKLNDKIVEQSTFLPLINIVPVDEMVGEVILGSATGPISGRTDTTGDGKRTPRNLLGLANYLYKLSQTDSDVSMRYSVMDTWAKFSDFRVRYARYVQERIANDRELIGWHGTHAAATTNLTAYGPTP